MSLGIVSELFKHVPVHLKRLRKLWLLWEQIFQSWASYTNMFFLIHLSGIQHKSIFMIHLLLFSNANAEKFS